VITIEGHTIETVGVVDDDEEARRSYTWTLEDAELQVADEDGPLGDLEPYASDVADRLDAVLCDHHLRVSNYAAFEGVELAARLYEKKVPAILCTSWATAELDIIRSYRDKVPVLLRPEQLDPGSFTTALEITIKELQGKFSPQRRPWRTLIHVVDADDIPRHFFYVRLPSWTSDEVIKLRQANLPPNIRQRVQRGMYLHAWVNVGTELVNELYFRDWEAA